MSLSASDRESARQSLEMFLMVVRYLVELFDVGLGGQAGVKYKSLVADCRGEGNVLASEADVSNGEKDT